MASGRPDPTAVRRLMKLAGVSPGGSATDRELIERFVRDRSEGAFADLMARHGPMVLAVCRRHLRDAHAADDAFQATFLVLARKAGSVRWRESVGGWLFEVATRVARKAAGQAARRAAREGTPAGPVPEPAAPIPPASADLTALQAALDGELARLPEKLRTPLVLCHLEGLSQGEVARHLGLSDGQLRGRLYRAKERVREGLLRRGFTLTAVLLALTVGGRASAVPAVLATATLRICSAPAGAVPAAVLHLTHGVIRDMAYTIKPLAALALLGVFGLGAAGVAARGEPQPAPAAAAAAAPLPATPAPAVAEDDDKKKRDDVEVVEGVIKAADAGKLKVKAEDENNIDLDVTVGPAVPVTFAGKPAKASDLKPGMRVTLSFKGNSAELLGVKASWKPVRSVAKAVDPAKGVLVIAVGNDEDGEFEVALTTAPDAAVTVDRIPAGLADIAPGSKVEVGLGLDKKTAVAVSGHGDPADLPAAVKGYDGATRTLTLEIEVTGGREERKVTLALPVASGAKVRYAGKDAALVDLKENMAVLVTLTPDRKAVAGMLAGPPRPGDADDDE